ncbi:MAG: ABC-type transport system involved in resistance to organic solvent [Betaproteobacteria bacterium]|jgi:phospholipid/cholesterol/gamma-HCH transport system substrate-binding protein|nr:ABC-type transport system involved in resistance to organic solvent [Betaproteobacteria bacterium]MEA3157104.1 phospholipid/cholesterol/gamma-HCH transport system substrate-binding protein [Betaproteobacteria bacterium]
MENKAHAFAAGLFTLLLGIAVVVAAMWFTGETYQKVYYVIESKSAVSGLYEQAAVRFRGVDVGKVTQIRIDRQNRRLILIEIGVQAGTPVTRSTYAEIRPQGVTGLSYVMLDDTGESTEPLPPSTQYNSPHIVARPTLLDNLFAASEEALGDVRQVAQRVSALLSDENREHFGRTLVSLEAASERFAALAKAAEPGVKSLGPLVSDARKTLQSADGVMTELSKAARELTARMEAIDRVAASADKAGASIGAMADSVSAESLPRINTLVEELTRTTRSLDRFVADVKERPQSLIFGRKPGSPGPGEQGFESRSAKGAMERPSTVSNGARASADDR